MSLKDRKRNLRDARIMGSSPYYQGSYNDVLPEGTAVIIPGYAMISDGIRSINQRIEDHENRYE